MAGCAMVGVPPGRFQRLLWAQLMACSKALRWTEELLSTIKYVRLSSFLQTAADSRGEGGFVARARDYDDSMATDLRGWMDLLEGFLGHLHKTAGAVALPFSLVEHIFTLARTLLVFLHLPLAAP